MPRSSTTVELVRGQMQKHAAELAAKDAEIAHLNLALKQAALAAAAPAPALAPIPSSSRMSAAAMMMQSNYVASGAAASQPDDSWVVERLAARRTVRRFSGTCFCIGMCFECSASSMRGC